MMERGRQFGTSRRVALPVPGLTSTAQRRRRHTPPSAENTTRPETKACKADSCDRPDTQTVKPPAERWALDDSDTKPGPACRPCGLVRYLWTNWRRRGVISELKPSSSGDDKPSCYFNHSHPLLENIATAAGFASGSAMVTANEHSRRRTQIPRLNDRRGKSSMTTIEPKPSLRA